MSKEHKEHFWGDANRPDDVTVTGLYAFCQLS